MREYRFNCISLTVISIIAHLGMTPFAKMPFEVLTWLYIAFFKFKFNTHFFKIVCAVLYTLYSILVMNQISLSGVEKNVGQQA